MQTWWVTIAIVLGTWVGSGRLQAGSDQPARTPVLVELFTSEGCSSCPPADAFLQKLDRQPIDGADVIVLSEHVDYWNHIGWKDPYSSSFYSERQSAYGERLRLSGVYTPQMVVDGAFEFVGSDQAKADTVIRKAAASDPKIQVRLSALSWASPDDLHAHIETAALPSSLATREADIYLAVAFDHAESQVSRGENAGRRLSHAAVVRKIVKIGTIKRGQDFAQDVQVKLDAETAQRNLRLIAFVQEPRQGKVFGAIMQAVPQQR